MTVALKALLALTLLIITADCRSQTPVTPGTACDFSNTDHSIRPSINNESTKLAIAIYLIDIPKVNDVEQSFIADIYLRIIWKDHRLARGQSNKCVVPVQAVWNPGQLILNQRGVERQLDEVVEIAADGTVIYRQRLFGTFSFPASLKKFPFDKQQLPISLLLALDPNNAAITPDLTLLGMTKYMSIANWKIGQPVSTTSTFQAVPGARKIARFDVNFPATRQSSYYVWKILVPMTVVVLMSWLVFWLSPKHTPPRIGLAATAMLTIIAFRLALGNTLPAIPYLTKMDIFTIGSTILVFSALLQTIVTTALWDSGREALARKINYLSRIGGPAILLLVGVLSFMH